MVHTFTQNIHTIIQTYSLATLKLSYTHKQTQSDTHTYTHTQIYKRNDTNTQINRYIQTQMHPQTQTDTDTDTDTHTHTLKLKQTQTHTNKQIDTLAHWSSNSFLRLITHKHRLFHPITTHAIRFICFLINVTHFLKEHFFMVELVVLF
jgi:hypothetical protein